MKKNLFKDSWLLFAGILLGIGILLMFVPLLVDYFGGFHKIDGLEKRASYIYGISTPFFGIATIILIARTYWLQKEQLIDTRQQLSNEKEQLSNTMKSLQNQRFEDTFFRLLENHHRIVEAMAIVSAGHEKIVQASKRDCFKYIYINSFDIKVNTFKAFNPLTPKAVYDSYDSCQNEFKSLLHNYFRFIYHILKFVKNAEGIEDKMQYTNILRATLSPYELVFLFYNGIHEFGNEDFLPLMEEFSFLKNHDDSLIFLEDKREGYDDLAFASSEERITLLPKWKKKHLIKT
jgi:hypothetical protein